MYSENPVQKPCVLIVISGLIDCGTPFLCVVGFGWKTASELVIGDRLLGMGDQSVRVDGIADSGRTDFVYNVTIEDDHTYFVGND